MKKIILSATLLVILYFLSSSLLDIPAELPEGTVVPEEVREILSEERIEQAIIYSNFRHGWYFFDNLLGFGIFTGILMLGISRSIRDKAKSWSEKIATFRNPPLVCGLGAALAALLLVFLTATEDHQVSSGSLGIALVWGIIGLGVGYSQRFALSAFYVLLFFLLLTLINFPLVYYRTFVVEHYFELSIEPFGKWIANFLKDNLVSYIFGILLVPLAYWGIRRRPKDWWLWVSAASVPIMVILIVITPVYLDPLFNTYEPLKDDVLRERILTMAEEAGISGSRVFQVDMSEETTKVNAYVTGLFGSKRIVMWDTILEKFTADELSFVMAHEMGHYVMNHIWKFIGILAVTLFVLLFIISRTINGFIRRFGDRMGFHELSDIASLPLLMLILSLLMFLITPALNVYSRSKEHDADIFGLELTRDSSNAITAFIQLANENLSNPSPHPFIEFWLYDHPTLSDRIEFCRSYSVEDGGELSPPPTQEDNGEGEIQP
jgi:Zn-dependent protease with chaperone function